MLGIGRSDNKWNWAVAGKHPVAADFFAVGRDSSIGQAFSTWIENGYRALAAGKTPFAESRSYRFWAMSTNNDTLVCGVVKDSCDSKGRPYPMLMIGSGVLKGWQSNWDLLPAACERTWGRLEYMAAKKFHSLDQLKGELPRITSPEAQWSGKFFSLQKPAGQGFPQDPGFTSNDISAIKNDILSRAAMDDFILPLHGRKSHEPAALIRTAHFLLKRQGLPAPNAVFMGGTVDKTRLAVFNRALHSDDFVRLWSADTPPGNPLTG